MIFVNTLKFAEIIHNNLRRDNYKSTIIFSKMDKYERDEYIEKFRKGEVQIVITTDLLARGFDMPEIELVINFDVPKIKDHMTGIFQPEPETYLHRIGRSGRFGRQGMAVTLFDTPDDEKIFW